MRSQKQVRRVKRKHGKEDEKREEIFQEEGSNREKERSGEYGREDGRSQERREERRGEQSRESKRMKRKSGVRKAKKGKGNLHEKQKRIQLQEIYDEGGSGRRIKRRDGKYMYWKLNSYKGKGRWND